LDNPGLDVADGKYCSGSKISLRSPFNLMLLFEAVDNPFKERLINVTKQIVRELSSCSILFEGQT
jgi:hypothetical protein